MRRQYGEKVPGETNVRKKERTVETANGEKTNKTRYSISGPNTVVGGLLNAGEYSIDNNIGRIVKMGQDYLTPIFDKWLEKQKQDPNYTGEDVHVMVGGHSRGQWQAERA